MIITTTLIISYISPSYSARYTFSGKERDTESGYSYFGARYYNSAYSIWMSVDPMSDKYPSISPYVYCGNNPVKLVDPDGEDVWIIGEESQAFFLQVKQGAKAYGISVKMDRSGHLSAKYRGKSAISEDGMKLMNAINDPTVKVNVSAIKHVAGTETDFMFGGAFGGNEITGGEMINGAFVGQFATAYQLVIPSELAVMDNFYNKPGQSSLHEITEAYMGARIAMSKGLSSYGTGTSSWVYKDADNAAIPQSGPVNRFFYKPDQSSTDDPNSARWIDWNVGYGTSREKNVKTTDIYKNKR
jgi:RHS repeat-associated protein